MGGECRSLARPRRPSAPSAGHAQARRVPGLFGVGVGDVFPSDCATSQSACRVTMAISRAATIRLNAVAEMFPVPGGSGEVLQALEAA
jgi:hypothetical protein